MKAKWGQSPARRNIGLRPGTAILGRRGLSRCEWPDPLHTRHKVHNCDAGGHWGTVMAIATTAAAISKYRAIMSKSSATPSNRRLA
jgi:hypothetical protein